jgi:hypothetical protein
MLPRKFPLSFVSNTTIAAAVAAVALAVAAPSGAMAGTAERNGTAARHVSTATDISAAHRRHIAQRRASTRSAYGSMIGGPVYEPPAYQGSSQGFGYGVGDNSNSYAQ